MSLRPIQQAALLGEIKGVAVLPRQVRNIGILYDPLAQVEEHLTFKIRSLIGKLISENIANSGKAKFTDMLIPSKRKENE